MILENMPVVARQAPGFQASEPAKPAKVAGKGTKRSASRVSSGEDSKRTRGRPRVEPQDETAADRRRTQIRLAQRTYRQRKETTITTLQTKVSHLENIIQEMFSSFQQVKQDVDSGKALEQDPTLSRKISDAARKFDQLARDAKVEPESPGGRGRGSVSEDTEELQSPKRGRPSKAAARRDMSKAQKGPKDPVPTIVSDRRGVPSVWGYETIYDDLDANTVAEAQNVVELDSREMVPNSSYGNESTPGYFDFSPQSFMMFNGFNSNPSSTPHVELALPKSMAHQETSFGRRLHRETLEAAVRLLRDPFVDQKKLLLHFSNIMQHTSQEEIANKFTERLMKGKTDPLETNHVNPSTKYYGPYAYQEWNIPHDDKGRPKYPHIGTASDVAWFRAKDVQTYLEAKGLHIDPSKATVEWETDMIIPQYPESYSPTPSAHNGEQVIYGTPGSLDSAPFFDFNSTGGNPHMGIELNSTMQTSAPPMATFGVHEMPTPSVTPTDYTNGALERAPKRVTIDVSKLIQNLIPAAVCSGKAPGYRRRDVERAFRKSIIRIVAL